MSTAFKQVSNNAYGTTATSYAATGVTTTTLTAGQGALFPVVSNGFYLTIWTGNNPGLDANQEIVTVTARAGDVLTHTATTKTHVATVNVALLNVAANVTEVQTAVNTIENQALANTSRTDQRGVALSGLEFSTGNLPGTAGTNYFVPQQADFQYFASKGLQLIRLPFLWERLQPYVNGALDSGYKAYIDNAITYARKYNQRIVLESHNFGRRYVPLTGGFTNDFTSTAGSWGGGQLSGGKYISDPNTFFSGYSGGDTRNPFSPATGYKFTGDVSITATTSGFPSLDIRTYDDGTGNNYYQFSLDQNGGVYSWSKRVAGVVTNIGSSVATIVTGTIYTVSIDINQTTANTVIIKVGATTIATFATDAALTGGKITIYNNFVKSSLDNVTLAVGADTTTANAADTYTIGTTQLPITAFADLWGKIATAYKNEPTVYMYDLMNEPYGMTVPLSSTTYNSTATVTLMNQAAINAIRAVDTNTWIALEFDQFSGLQSFVSFFGANPTKWWTDPSNKTMISFHYYQDTDHSGSYASAWSTTLRTRLAGEVLPAFQWAQTNNVPLYLGEYGVPYGTTSDAVNWQTDLDSLMQYMDEYRVYGCYWAAGQPYSSGTTLQPTNNYLTDRETMPIVQKHLSFSNLNIDASAVHLAGAETITGAKTLGADLTLNNAVNINLLQSGGRNYKISAANLAGDQRIVFVNTNASDNARYWFDSSGGGTGISFAEAGSERLYLGTDAGDVMLESKGTYGIKFRTNSGTEMLRINTSTGHITPGANLTQNLGSTALYWGNLFSRRVTLNSTAYLDGTTAGQIQATGLIMPVQATTAAAPAYVKGGMYFDTTLNKLRIGGVTAWETVTSS